MTDTEVDLSQGIISGLNFLVCEAGGHPNPQIARIIRMALRDVCLALEQKAHERNDDSISRLLDSDLYYAIQFLTKYASIKDTKLRNEIMKEIESIKDVVNRKSH